MRHKVLYSSAGIATQILVHDQEFIILLDIGDGIIRDLLEEDFVLPFSIPLYILITHGHYDHCGSLFSFLGFLRMLGHTSPVNILYPTDSIEIKGLIDLFLSSYPETIPYELIIRELLPQDEIAITKEIKIVAFRMRHMGSTLIHGQLPEIPALGFAIFKGKNKILAYTGDTGINDSLPDLLKGANHAYIEASNLNEHHSPYHLNKSEAEKLGKLAKNFSLVHTRRSKKKI